MLLCSYTLLASCYRSICASFSLTAIDTDGAWHIISDIA